MFLLLLILALLTLASVACITLALRSRNATPIWRAIAGIASSETGTASAILYYSTAVYARLIGGFPFYDPALLRMYRYGALSALLGVLLAVLAKGRVRVGAISLSIFILLLWILVGEFIKAAVDNGRRAEELLPAHPELINARWMHNETLVHFLAVGDSVRAVAFLAEHGADMNAVNEFGDAPLIDVAVLGFNDIAQVILRHGADPNANAGSEGRSNALDCAVRAGNSGLVEMLLEAGANARYSTDLGETIFDALPESEERRQSILVVLAQHGIKARSG